MCIESSQGGELFVQQPYNTPNWDLSPAKEGDVGLDLPVRIRGMQGAKLCPRVLEHGPDLVDFEEGIIVVPPHAWAVLPTGLHVKIPDNAWGAIRPRSSSGWRKRIHVFEGTIDSGYTGQLACLVSNPLDREVSIRDGERVAQLVLIPKYELLGTVQVEELPKTNRGFSGLGSTGD